jgi:hypothetical protein
MMTIATSPDDKFDPRTTRSLNPVDIQLRELAAAACQHAPGSLQRNRHLTQLIHLVQHDRRYYRCGSAQPEHYAEAQSRSWFWLVRNIHRYDPTLAEVMTWVNNRIKWDLRTVGTGFGQWDETSEIPDT